MALIIKDRVKEATTTTGTIPFVLGGAVNEYQTFSSTIGDDNTTPYAVEDVGGVNWEVGIGQYIGANNSLIRTTILASSNNNSIVNFSDGPKNIFVTVPADYTALTARDLTQFAPTTAADLRSIIVDDTGTGSLVFSNNAVLVNPTLGTANGTSLYLTNDLIAANVYISDTTETLTKTDGVEGWSYLAIFNQSGQENAAGGVSMSADGTNLYVVGTTNDTVYQYPVITPYDISTATTVGLKSYSVTSTAGVPVSIFFKPDGTAFYILNDSTTESVQRFNLSTAWDVSTATYVDSYAFTIETSPAGLEFSPDGTKMHIIGTTNDTVYQFALSTAWDLSTAATTATYTFSVTAFDSAPSGIEFNSTGTIMYIVGTGNDSIIQYNLSTAWNITTAVYSQRLPLITSGFTVNAPRDIYVDLDNNVMLIVDDAADRVFQYNTNTNALKIIGNQVIVNPKTVFNNEVHVQGLTRFIGNIEASNALTVSGAATIGSTFTVNGTPTLAGATTSGTTLGTSATTGTTIIGGTTQTGDITVGRSTVSQTLNFGIGATIAANTKTVNIGINGVASSITNVNIGNSAGTSTVTVGSTVQAATVNLATGVNASGVTKTVNIGTNGASGSITNINIGSAVAGSNGNTYFNQPLEINNGLTVRRTATQFLTIKNDNVTVSPFISSYTANNNAKQLYFDCSTLDLTAPTGGSLGYVFRVNEVPAFSIHTSGSSIFTNNSSGSAVRITQTGTGAALTVEDETNPDSTPFVIDAAGNVGIGTSSPTAKLDVVGSVKISQDLSITGNVYISGNTTTLSSNNLVVNDSIIYMANNNPANINDIGFVGNFTSGTYQHTGFVRDATDGVWKLFSNVVSEPTNTVDFTSAVYDSIQVGTVYGSLYGNANTATVLSTGKTIALSGAATGTATSFDGSQNITIPVIELNSANLSGIISNSLLNSGTTSAAGIVQLTDSISDTSITTAATANSVKIAYDAATIANTNAANASVLSTGTVPVARLSGIPNSSLSNSTISGVQLGSNLASLVIGTGLSGSSYNGYSGTTISIDSTVATLSGTQTLTGKTVTNLVLDGNYTEEVYAIVDGASVDLNPANGTVQTWTLGASRSPTATGFQSGQSITLMIDDGTAYAITWPSVTWKSNAGVAPTLNLTGYTIIQLWKVGAVLYGARVGDA